jgi:glycosyltransferase involved in cell wall biosynthesis
MDRTWGSVLSRTDIHSAPQKPIRVLFISHDAGMWGAQRTLLTLLSAIDRRVCSPLLVVPNEGPLGEMAAGNGIPVFVRNMVHWISDSSATSPMRRLRYRYRFLRTLNVRCKAIERLITENGIDLVYTNTVTCIEGAIAAKRTRKPHLWHIHEPIMRNSELIPLLPFWFYCAVMKSMSNSVIFPSKALAIDYPQFSRMSYIVYNGLPPTFVRDRPLARAKLKNILCSDTAGKLIAVLGALQPRKDILTFLTAAEQVAKRVENSIFLIVGTGFENYTNLIRNRIKELNLDSKVILLGYWKDDVYDLLAAIDVLVISSEQESFGLTAIEALAMETPVVATRCGGPEEVLMDGKTGFLVPVKEPGPMADAIVRLLMSPELARCMGATGRKHVSEFFGVDRYVQGIQRAIQETGSINENV